MSDKPKKERKYLKKGKNFLGGLYKKAAENPEAVAGIGFGALVADLADSLTFGLLGGVVGATGAHIIKNMVEDDDEMMENETD